MSTFAVVAIMKNESRALAEWVNYYINQGAGGIFIVDNGSEDKSFQIAQDLQNQGKVVVERREKKWAQLEHQRHMIASYNLLDKFQWILICDLDEFLFSKNKKKLKLEIENLDFQSLVYFNWMNFGSAGFEKQPESIIKSFTLRHEHLASHKYTKYIFRTSALQSLADLGVHKVRNISSDCVVTDNHNFQLNHYPIQSREFFRKVKMTRGDAVSADKSTLRDWNYFHSMDSPAIVEDMGIIDVIDN